MLNLRHFFLLSKCRVFFNNLYRLWFQIMKRFVWNTKGVVKHLLDFDNEHILNNKEKSQSKSGNEPSGTFKLVKHKVLCVVNSCYQMQIFPLRFMVMPLSRFLKIMIFHLKKLKTKNCYGAWYVLRHSLFARVCIRTKQSIWVSKSANFLLFFWLSIFTYTL